MVRGTDRQFQITAQLRNPDTGVVTGPLDLTGAAISFTAKRSMADLDANAVITKSVGSGITITNGPGGLATLALVPADTLPLEQDRISSLVYSVEVVEASGKRSEIAQGVLYVDPKVKTA